MIDKIIRHRPEAHQINFVYFPIKSLLKSEGNIPGALQANFGDISY